MNNEQKQAIAFVVIEILKSRFDSFPNTATISRNAPFHKAFLQAFSKNFEVLNLNMDASITISSWIHGLNTTLGQSFFEKTAQIISGGQKRAFKDKKIYSNQVNTISNIMIDLKNGTQKPNIIREERLLMDSSNGNLTFAQNFVADCIFEEKDRVVVIELKSVRPNSGQIHDEKQKILSAKAVLKQLYPDKSISYYFGFPFDPLSDTETGCDKQRFMNSVIEFSKFCDAKEILIASELWDFLSGQEHTMEDVLKIIRDISTVDFNGKFDFISSSDYLDDIDKYKGIVLNWNIYNEIEIINNFDKLLTLSNINKIVYKNIHSSPFNQDGTYNIRRYNNLKKFITTN